MENEELVKLREELTTKYHEDMIGWVIDNSEYIKDKIEEEIQEIVNNWSLKDLQKLKKEFES